jgi:hypothetical protein
MPGGEDGRLILVRSVDLGRFQANASSSAIALTLANRLSHLGRGIVHGSDDAAGSATAVYFNGPLEPFLELARRLVRVRPAGEWFWRLAVPSWRPNQGAGESLCRLLLEVAGAEWAPAGIVALVDLIHRERGLGLLAASLKPAEAEHLLLTMTGRLPDAEEPRRVPDAGELVPPPQQPVRQFALSRELDWWTARWPSGDVRAMWLAVLAVADGHPTRLSDPGIFRRAQSLISALATRPPSAAPQEFTAQVGPSSPSESPQAESRQAALPVGDGPAVDSSPQLSARAANPISNPLAQEWCGVHLDDETELVGVQADRGPISRLIPAVTAEETGSSLSTVEGPIPTEYLMQAPGPNVPATQRKPDEGQPTMEQDLTSSAADYQVADAPVQSDDPPRLAAPRGALFSRFAGLYLSIPLFEHLGLPAWLENDPLAAQEGLGHRLLQRIALESGAHLTDQALLPLQIPEGLTEPEIWSFALPEVWAEAPWNPGGLAERCTSVSGTLEAWVRAAGLWCNRYTEFTLQELVCRPGRVLVTPTHLDVYFRLADADVRVRKGGLDLNPGWVPWFGRVVTYWYREGDR